MTRRRVLIIGAAGRDFHNFNVVFREDETHEVVGFTAAQIPNIDDRRYPAALAGKLYPEGIPIFPEDDLEKVIADLKVDECVFSYSDVSYDHVGHISARCNAAGADFRLLGTRDTMLKAKVPVIAVCAVRTGCGKSQTSRWVAKALQDMGKKVVAVRHPMPYGDLAKQAVQRFAKVEDMDEHECTFEEREEYESHIKEGNVIYAGVDYGAILEQAQEECDVLIWDGGNNDWPFYTPDLWITVADPLRAGHETKYFPGEVNFRAAQVICINKAERATAEEVKAVQDAAAKLNPSATVIRCASKVSVADPDAVKGKKVLCIEDGPTLTHGGMTFGAAQVAAETFGAAEVVDPRPHFKGSIQTTYETYPHIGKLLPAMGYFEEQIADLKATIDAVECDLILVGTPFDLAANVELGKPAQRVNYVLDPFADDPSLLDELKKVVA
ncbi:MAG: cyclic 2,3-diphosphoglycerate synthase [Deltaproteobacteria bacterium]|nr:cyclic 2,3-diphosphoglycerate synthase [Deltaproteobacteria bacterium]